MITPWIPFHFDSNQTSGTIDSLAKWVRLVDAFASAPTWDNRRTFAWGVDWITGGYVAVLGAPGTMPSFGVVSKCGDGTKTSIRQWAEGNGMLDLLTAEPADHIARLTDEIVRLLAALPVTP